MGGVARRATVIAEERSRGDPVLVLDAGNSLTGDRDPALKTEGASSVEAMNRLGYDAVALGSADLGLGPAVLRSRMAEAHFPFLSANAVERRTGKLLAAPYVIREIDGHRVAIAGLSAAGDTDAISVLDPLSAVKEVVVATRGKADEIIVLSNVEAATNHEIADNVAGITAVVEGGSGTSTGVWVSSRTGTPVFHADRANAGHAGRVLGVARLSLNQHGELQDHTWRQFSLGPEVAEDGAVAAWVKTQVGK